MAHKSWLKGLLHRVSKPTPATSRKRPAFSPVNIENLEDRTTPVALDWTGAAGTNWNTPGNWVQNQVPSAANNVLNFSSATAGINNYTSNNDIAGLTGLTINITDTSAAKDFAITGLNVGVTAVSHSKTDSQASTTTLGLAMTGAAATVTDTAGSLTILNTNNVFDAASTVNVPTGATLIVAVFPSSSLGSAKYNLTGGALAVGPSGAFFTNAFNVGQNATANDITAAGTPLASLGTDMQLYPMMADISRSVPAADTQFPTNTHTWGNNHTYFYSGEIFFPNSNNDGTGSIAFAAANDDSSTLYIDGAQYYGFTNNTSAASLDPNTGGNAVTLPTGWHTIDLRFGNGGGGAGPNNNATNGATGWVLGNGSTSNPTGKGFGYRIGEPVSAPVDAKNYRRLYAAPNVYGINAITESGTTVTVTTAAPGTTTQMNSSVKVGDKVTIAGVTPVQYNGLYTVATVTGNTFTYTHPQSGLAAGAVTNSTTLTLPDDGTQRVRYGISAITASGATVTVTTAAPGTTTAMPSGVQVGDKVVINGITGVTAYNGTWTVTGITGDSTFTFDHTTSGLAAGAVNAANSTVGLPDDKVRVRVPTAANGVVGNAVSVSGNSTITLDPTMVSATMGNLTMASGAALNVVAGNAAGQTLSLGTTSLAGNVTFSSAAGATLNLAGAVSQTAAASITKTGAGSLILGAANTYSGATTISAGSVTAAVNGSLGTSTGAADGTTVASGGRLVIGANYSNLEVLSLAGTGSTATNGALSSAATATYAGPITLTGNTWIASSANTLTLTGGITAGANRLTFAGAGNVTLQTAALTGSGTITKTETGTARFNIANPGITGDINVTGGTLRVSVDGALGTVAGGTNVSPGATLLFDTLTTYTALEPFTIGGPGVNSAGALQSQTNNVTLNSPLKLTGSTTIGSATAGFKLTLNGAISMAAVSTLTFTGAGNIDVAQPFGNGSTPTVINNAFQAVYLHDTSAARTTTSMTIGVAPGNTGVATPGKVFEGGALMTGPLNYVDADTPSTGAPLTFGALFGVPSMDLNTLNTLFTAQMKVTTAGTYRFAFGNQGALTNVQGADALGSIYLDIDKNGVFEDATGENLLSLIAGNAAVPTGIPLTPGVYNIAIPETNGSGGSFLGVVFSADDGNTWKVIDPSDPTQAGMWSTTVTPANNVVKNGAGTVTLLGNNTYNGTTTINAGTLAAAVAGSFGSTKSVVVNSGGSLGVQGGLNLTVPLSLVGTGAGGAGAINNLGGTNTIAGPLTISGNTSIGSAGGTLNLNGTINLALVADLTFTGAGDVNVAKAFGNGFTPLVTNGFFAGYFHDTSGARTTTNMTIGAAPGNTGVADPGRTFEGTTRMTGPFNYVDANTPSTGAPLTFGALFGVPNMDLNTLNTYFTAQMKVTTAGTYRFAFGNQGNLTNVQGADALGSLFLDIDRNGKFENATGENLMELIAGNAAVQSGIPLTPGVYNIAIPETNGSGGSFLGVVFSADDGNTWKIIDPSDPAQAGMWTTSVTPANNVVKTGAGTLTFMASNTYNGNTTVDAGTLATTVNNALGNSPTSTLTVSGATTVVNLFDSATAVTNVGKADFSIGGPTVNTGAGKLAVATQLILGDGYVATGNLTAQGASLAKSAVPRTLTAVTGPLKIDGPGQNGTISRVNAPSNFFVAGGGTQSTTYTVTGGNVLVVEVGQRSVMLPPVAVTYNGVALTKVINATYNLPTNREVSLWYLLNPTPANNAALSVTTTSGNSELWISAFTLSGVNTSVLPETTPGHAAFVSNANGDATGLATGAALSNVAAGSWIVIGLTGNPNGSTYSWTTSGAANLSAVSYVQNNTNATTSFGTGAIQGVTSTGNYTVNTGQTPAGAITKSALVAAVFAPGVASFSPINLPQTDVVLSNNTSLVLSGSGAATLGSVSAVGSASIGTGTPAPSSLTIGGSGVAGAGTLGINNNLGLKLATGSTYKVDVNGIGTLFDQTNVNGAVDLTGATLNVTTGSGFTPAVGSTYVIISNDGADAVTGAFTGLPQGATVVGGAGTYTISYNGGDGNDVVLTATAAGATTTTTLTATPLATTGGSSVQFTATVAPSPGALGTVNFLENGAAITGGSNVAVVGGQAIFSTTTLAVGSRVVTAAYSGAAGFAGSTSTPVTVTITSGGGAAPTVSSMTINGGVTSLAGNQRSRVVNVTVAFDQAVLLDLNAMTLALHTGNVTISGNPGQPAGATLPSAITVTPSTDNKTWTMTFGGANTVDTGADLLASLKDGVYKLTIDAAKVHLASAPGTVMAANQTLVFDRLFGDATGASGGPTDFTAVVNAGDNLQFRNAFGKPVGGGYQTYFDFNGDGQVNTFDNLQFRNRFNKNLTWTV